ncbi:D-alanyl-D-alanine carboxypeptidase family protein [Gorillibacterium sp. CAU 1737]|uniref:D-alanyl-D-alanine carboxypeptidase family protein n=1 Tax=Gorillibacterium sp. CAU 1737 TaxID=3140362 RepID=UPI0032618D66
MNTRPTWPLTVLLSGVLLATAGCTSSGKFASSAEPDSSGLTGAPTASPTGTLIPEASEAPQAGTSTPLPVVNLSSKPTVKPTAKPTAKPTPAATPKATAKPTVKPTAKPTAKPSPSAKPQGAVTTIAKPAEIAVWVNKTRKLPADYVPTDLVVPNVRFSFSEKLDKRKLRKEAADALEKLFAAADKEGVKLFAVSGYRSYKTQESLFSAYSKRDGEAAAARYSARPGTSEHQTGLAMDVSSASAKYQLTEAFGDTKEGKWLAKHAPDYGFIIRYPKGTEKITGYMYEPWHIRYLGKELAADVTKSGLTLDEYFNEAVPVQAP